MVPPMKQQTSDRQRRAQSKDSDEEDAPSANLWVGNLSPDTTESDLLALFAKYGVLDSVTSYASRNYAFVYFKNADDAKAAKDTLQGALVRGSSIRIQFAKPAKPCKHLWIGGISPNVLKKELEDEFSKFGEIEEFKLLRDRNCALANYFKIEDAVDALKNMNGKSFDGEQIRVDYVRSQPPRRDSSDFHDSWMASDSLRNFPESSQYGHKRSLHGAHKERQPSKILYVRYPPSARIDEQMLHNAMILFGEIERIKMFTARNYAFVEFRSVEEAWRAKEGLQGRLFNDPRIHIMFSHSDLAPAKDNPSFILGSRGSQSDVLYNDSPFGPMELFVPGRAMGSSTFPGPLPPNMRTNMIGRPFGPQGFDGVHGGPDCSDMAIHGHNFVDGTSMPWRRLSPTSGILQFPPTRPSQCAWDEFDPRDAKRARVDGTSFNEDISFSSRMMDGKAGDSGFQQPDKGTLGHSFRSPSATLQNGARIDHCWRGIIAKGGTPVCHARCIPIGKGIASPLPEVVNCSARTGLDMLAKHYADACGFDIVFFLPDSEEDFASYTEFLRYLGSKNRAGVAKFDDGTTLFLVPPSDFLTKTLNVSGPERLYGVVLKIPQQSTISGQELQAPSSMPYIYDRSQIPYRAGTNSMPQHDSQVARLDNSRVAFENLASHAGVRNPLISHTEEAHHMPSFQGDHVNNVASTSKGDHVLPPELLASLATFLPSDKQSSTLSTVQPPPLPSSMPPSYTGSVMSDKAAAQGWNHDQGVPVYHGQILQMGQHVINQPPVPSQIPNYGSSVTTSDPSFQSVPSNIHVQDPGLHTQHATDLSGRTSGNFGYASHVHYTSSGNQQYQLDAYNSQKGYHMAQTGDVGGVHNSLIQQPVAISSTQDPSGGLVQSQNSMLLPTSKVNTELSAHSQQLQSSLPNTVQGSSASEADKNQRYQSTLQFAASLLMQIQQQQQQASPQSLQGSGNQQ